MEKEEKLSLINNCISDCMAKKIESSNVIDIVNKQMELVKLYKIRNCIKYNLQAL